VGKILWGERKMKTFFFGICSQMDQLTLVTFTINQDRKYGKRSEAGEDNFISEHD
jgi:hypothetical protein